MAKSMCQSAPLPITGVSVRRARYGAVLLLGFALIAVPHQVVFGQSNQQQEQQEQQRQQQEQQQRQEQQRQQQEQQQREEQQRQQQEQQQREQQQREQQEQQQREQQERAQQEREHASGESAAPASNANSMSSRPAMQPPVPEVKRAIPDTQTPDAARKINPSTPVKSAAAKEHESPLPEADLRRKICEKGPCPEPKPMPVPPEPPRTICKDGPCQTCPPGRSAGKDGCAPPPSAKAIAPQTCPAGQIWNGSQCMLVGAQRPCPPGQTGISGSCQTDCATPTAGAQNHIMQRNLAHSRALID